MLLIFLLTSLSGIAEAGKLSLSEQKGELTFTAMGRAQVELKLFNDAGRRLRLTSYSKP